MSATAQFVVLGVFAGFVIIVSIALRILFRRVADLQRTISTNAEQVDSGDEFEDGPVEAFDTTEDDSPFVHFSQRHFRAAPPRPERQRPAAVSSFAEDEQRPLKAVSFDDALAAYNALVANFSQAELRAFEQRWHPQSVARTAENSLADDPQGDFWLIRTGDADQPYGLVVPGPEVVRKWELYYRSMGSLAAKNLLAGLYDVGDGAPLRLEKPAIATPTVRGWRVETQGIFADA